MDLGHESNELANNASDWTLRPAVGLRKLSVGSQTSKGSRFVERLLTAIATCH